MKETEYYSEKRKGLIGTIVFHVIVLLLLIFFGFFTPLPLPGEEGILVNFGDSETGLGEREPAPARRQQQQQTPPPQQKQEQKSTPPPAATTPPPAQQSKPEPAKEVAMTQDYEKTAAIDAAEKKKREDEKKRQDELAEARRKEQAEAQAKAKAETDAKAKAEAEARAKAQAEAERKAREEAERKKKEEEQRKINEINSRTQGAFANSGGASGGTGSGDEKSQGITFPGGNQGVPTGDSNAANYGGGGSGSGENGSGISFSLSGRSALSLPKPQYPGNDAGLVVVKVTVDKNGKVTSAEPGVKGTTIMDQKFWNEAKQAALKARFDAKENAPAFQQGTISYRFVLD